MLGPLRAAAGSLGVELVEVSTPEQALAVVAGADAFVGGADLVKVIQHAGPSLRWVHVQSAGVESYPHEVIEKAGVTLTNSAVIYGPQLADHVMALILAFSRQLPFLFQAQQEQRWASRSEYPPVSETREQTRSSFCCARKPRASSICTGLSVHNSCGSTR